MKLKVTEHQKKVLRKVWRWYIKQNKPFLTFGGYAGTGKTTMIAFLRKELDNKFPELKVAFCSYTGKATRVLEETLKKHFALYEQDITGTIHSLIYEPVKDKNNRIKYWEKSKDLEADLIILDEASMVDAKIWADLRSYKIPILAVGDHGQLPPIEGSFNLMEKPDLKLEKIHRQAKGNKIIQLSEKVRNGEDVAFADYGDVKKLDKTNYETQEYVEEMLRNFNKKLLVLVGFNWARVELNKNIRKLNNFYSEEPQITDRIICLKNNYSKGVFNGMLGEVRSIKPVANEKGEELWYQMEAKMDDGNIYKGRVLKEQFGSKTTLRKAEGITFDEMGDLFDFGYAITVHKAQGSQAPKVLLFEQRFKNMEDEEWHRWLYTAVTRAEKELVIVA